MNFSFNNSKPFFTNHSKNEDQFRGQSKCIKCQMFLFFSLLSNFFKIKQYFQQKSAYNFLKGSTNRGIKALRGIICNLKILRASGIDNGLLQPPLPTAESERINSTGANAVHNKIILENDNHKILSWEKQEISLIFQWKKTCPILFGK